MANSGLTHPSRKPGLHHPAEVISDYNWTGLSQPGRRAGSCPVPVIHSLFRETHRRLAAFGLLCVGNVLIDMKTNV